MVGRATASEPGAARRPLVVGNWKMNGSVATNAALLGELSAAAPFAAAVSVCVPAPYLRDVASLLGGSADRLGRPGLLARTTSGAFTGEVSATMLAELGCRQVIVGHSERRALHGESDALVAAKAAAALAAGLVPIVCVGETLAERDAGQTEAVVGRQLGAVVALLGNRIDGIVVAYEPVWAIGTGKTASPAEAQAVHASCAAASPPRAPPAMRCASSTAAASSPTTRPSYSPKPTSTAA